jgi:hypothetical protein
MDTNDIIAISAAIIALASLYVAIQNTRLARKHNRLSVRPFLSIYRKEFRNQPIEYIVENRGIGPAIVKYFCVLVDGNEVLAQDGNCIYAAMDILEINRDDVGGHLFSSNEVLKAGQDVVVLRLPKSGDNESLQKDLLGKLSRMKFRILYESMYDEQYEFYGNG